MTDFALLPVVVSVPLFLLIGFTLFDIVRRVGLSGVRKVLWAILVVALPIVGTFLYLMARPFRDPAHLTARGSERTHTIVELVEDHEAGSIGDEEFAAAKHRVFEAAVAANRAKHR